jgi:hypothetical protein
MNNSQTGEIISVSIIRGANQMENQMEAIGRYTAECLDANGNVKWSEEFDNLVTTEGKNHLLNHGIAGPATAVNSRM